MWNKLLLQGSEGTYIFICRRSRPRGGQIGPQPTEFGQLTGIYPGNIARKLLILLVIAGWRSLAAIPSAASAPH